jgi:hypothetical protein
LLSTSVNGFREALTDNVSLISSFIIVMLMNIFGMAVSPSGYPHHKDTTRSTRTPITRIQEPADKCKTRNDSGTGPPCLKEVDEIHSQFKPHREHLQE